MPPASIPGTATATQPQILIAYRHGLRASELCELTWSMIEYFQERMRYGLFVPDVDPRPQ
jgi:hypothetical protein